MSHSFNSAKDMEDRGFLLRDPPVNILNYDPAGDGDDNDALVLVSREEWRRGELHDPDLAMEYIFRVLLAYRLPIGLEFPEKMATILALNRQLVGWQRQGRQYAHVLGVEQNGIGYGMASSLRMKTPTKVLGYTTVGATSDRPFSEKSISMPRLAALDNLRVLSELHRVKIAKDCTGAKDLVSEMNGFVWRRPGRPEAIKGQNDDLVMALCGAVWLASRVIPPVTKQVKADPRMGFQKDVSRGGIRIN